MHEVAQRVAHARQNVEHEARVQVGADLEQQLRGKAQQARDSKGLTLECGQRLQGARGSGRRGQQRDARGRQSHFRRTEHAGHVGLGLRVGVGLRLRLRVGIIVPGAGIITRPWRQLHGDKVGAPSPAISA